MLILLRTLIVLVMAVSFQYILTQRRFSPKKSILILLAGVAVVFSVNAVFFISTDYLLFNRLYPLTVILPVVLLFVYLSKYRGFRLLFNALTAVFLSMIISISGYLLSLPFGLNETASIIGRIAAFLPLLYFIVKVFRPLYMQMLDKLKKGWALFCLIPLLSYAATYFLIVYPVSIIERPENIAPAVLVLAVVIAAYAVILTFFRQMQQQFALQNEQQLLKIQVDALQNQLNVVAEVDERTKILRHDLRHNTQNIAVLMQNGELKKALEFVGKFDEMFEQTHIDRYCENPALNAILTHYLESAKKEGISIKTRLDIPEKIPIDEMELCAVFANAIENARHACRKLPEGAHKSIELICVSKPHFGLEAANTYCGEVQFGKDNLPVSKEDGHGIGTQSIAAFVKKHNAILDYQTGNGMFRLRILLP